jgi:hypothetical protein
MAEEDGGSVDSACETVIPDIENTRTKVATINNSIRLFPTIFLPIPLVGLEFLP